jgi:purine-binding chemotaxis protein CheW
VHPGSDICENQERALSTYLDSLVGALDLKGDATLLYACPLPVEENEAYKWIASPFKSSEVAERYFCFTVGGLRLALPSMRVAKIAKFTECAGEGASPLHAGYVDYGGRLVPVLSTAELIMPGRAQPITYQLIVVDAAGRFALACHSVDPELDIRHGEVRWQTDRTARRSLAGSLIQKRCALLDIEALARLAGAIGLVATNNSISNEATL